MPNTLLCVPNSILRRNSVFHFCETREERLPLLLDQYSSKNFPFVMTSDDVIRRNLFCYTSSVCVLGTVIFAFANSVGSSFFTLQYNALRIIGMRSYEEHSGCGPKTMIRPFPNSPHTTAAVPTI